MKNYFQKILSLFTEYDYSETTNQHFYRWLLDSKHEKEKDEALQELYSKVQEKGDVPNLEESLERWRQNANIRPMPSKNNRNKKIFLRLWQSAAIILLLISISLGYTLSNTNKIEFDWAQQYVPAAQKKTFFLPDGTQVQMNSKSLLLYPTQFTGPNRKVLLIGEAFFKIKPDENKPFIVKTDDIQITALGTEFNVSAFAEDKKISTTLITGSVLVEYDNLAKKVLLQPNQQIIYDKESHQATLNYPDIEEVTAWQRGELVLRQKTLFEIIAILECKYNYEFIYNFHGLNNDCYTFRFKDMAPLSEVMDVIVDVVGNLNFKIQNDKCYIMQRH